MHQRYRQRADCWRVPRRRRRREPVAGRGNISGAAATASSPPLFALARRDEGEARRGAARRGEARRGEARQGEATTGCSGAIFARPFARGHPTAIRRAASHVTRASKSSREITTACHRACRSPSASGCIRIPSVLSLSLSLSLSFSL